MKSGLILFFILVNSILCFADDGSRKWIRPDGKTNTDPYWGIKGGIAFSYPPHQGVVRGLIGIHAPYLGHSIDRVINYIAIEPIVENTRGFSELEKSNIDNKQGLKIRSSNDFIPDFSIDKISDIPASGVISNKDGIETLSVYLYTETFENGSKPIIQAIISDAAPNEITFRVFDAKDSKKFRTCILTSTMGNYAQLRNIWLADKVVHAKTLWEDFKSSDTGFAEHRNWRADEIMKIGKDAVVACATDISDPEKVDWGKIPYWWQYHGKLAVQYWKVPNYTKDLIARVNARSNYYGQGITNIPGGIAFENFEVEEPYVSGQEFRFGVTTDNPESLGFKAPAKPKDSK